jgi:hypothetical protein
MVEKRNPGARGGAAGAGAFHATAGNPKIARAELLRHLERTGGAHD